MGRTISARGSCSARGSWCTTLLPALAVAVFLVPACSDGRSKADLHLVSFAQDQHAGLFRDQVLTLEFSARVDLATIDPDTFQIFDSRAPAPAPFVGLFEVDRNIVLFHPAVDEDDPRRGWRPVNPYGFAENTTYRVRIPGTKDTPRPLKVLHSMAGRPMLHSFAGEFTTGTEFGPRPGEGAPSFAPFEPAVFKVPGANHVGTAEPHDDVLSYAPQPNPSTPPIHPVSRRPDFRAGHPTHVRAQLTFTRVMDPRSFRAGAGGNIRMEFESPGTSTWNSIPAAISYTPNGRTFILTAATPLAHATRYNKYRVVLDQATTTLTSRSGKPLVMAVEKWDDTQQRMRWEDVSEPHLTFWCAMVAGESGPLLTATFPLQSFSKDAVASDADVVFASGRLDAGEVRARASEDTTPCSLPGPACSLALREPLTQSLSSSKPNPSSKGPSKIQFLYNSPQHGMNGPSSAYKLANAEALTGMGWGPLCATVIKSTYPKLYIHVMWSDRNSTAALPVGLVSTTYDNNFDHNPPGFAVRDGMLPYAIEQSSANATWYPWKFERPFTDYRSDKGLVFMAWTETGGEVEQYPRWYSPNYAPNTRVFSGPSTQANPPVGLAGQWCYYWTRFEFERIRSLAVSHYFRLTANDADKPLWHAVVVSPSPANLPGGTNYLISYSGARFSSYSQQGGSHWRGVGTPQTSSSWSTNITGMNELPAVAIRVVFTANPTAPNDLPYLDGVAFTYRLK